ncbi:hydroxyisourate hydrolase [Phytomonospora sp. NPDC050363]|uniref:hydroxyisourate hydrolase n=1 Tax=Phytomonospora sp. NPDC050363 TaxID=3155642 RepID=UPI0033EE4B23
MTISTHVLDSTRGRPVSGMLVLLDYQDKGDWKQVASARTDADGRIRDWGSSINGAGLFRLAFHTGVYFGALGVHTIYPEIAVSVLVTEPTAKLHVPLLLSPFAYSTYQGS